MKLHLVAIFSPPLRVCDTASVSMHPCHRADAHKQYRACRMRSVDRLQEGWCVVKRDLATHGGGEMRQAGKLVIVANSVCLDASEELILRARRLGRFA